MSICRSSRTPTVLPLPLFRSKSSRECPESSVRVTGQQEYKPIGIQANHRDVWQQDDGASGMHGVTSFLFEVPVEVCTRTGLKTEKQFFKICRCEKRCRYLVPSCKSSASCCILTRQSGRALIPQIFAVWYPSSDCRLLFALMSVWSLLTLLSVWSLPARNSISSSSSSCSALSDSRGSCYQPSVLGSRPEITRTFNAIQESRDETCFETQVLPLAEA